MIVKITAIRDEQSMTIDLGEGAFEIKDTIGSWLITDSKERVIGIFDKFSTVFIALIEEGK